MNDDARLMEPEVLAPAPTCLPLGPARVFHAHELFGADAEIGLLHEGSLYRLRKTRVGKLILTK